MALDDKDHFEAKMPVIIHLQDWNMQDKYYEVPWVLMVEFRDRVLQEDGIEKTWTWFVEQVNYGRPEDAGKPVLTGRVDMTLPQYFVDWTEAVESVSEW